MECPRCHFRVDPIKSRRFAEWCAAQGFRLLCEAGRCTASDWNALRGKGRRMVVARHALMWAIHEVGCSYVAIGEVTGHHHTSVMHACELMRRRVVGGAPYLTELRAALLVRVRNVVEGLEL